MALAQDYGPLRSLVVGDRGHRTRREASLTMAGRTAAPVPSCLRPPGEPR
jgi:hypothetical protein